MPLRNVATTFTIEQQRLEINALAGDVNNIATGVTNVGTAATANALAAGATGADLTLSGTLTVNGSQTILNTATLEVEDKNIIIAKGSTTDAAASGGGITLKGADDKTLLYDQAGDEWQFNKPLRVEGSQEYASSASNLATSVTTAAFRVKGATNSSDSLFMGVESTDANPYIQGNNGVGNNAKKLLLNPFGGNVGVNLSNPDVEFHVLGGGTVARFEGTGGNGFISLMDSDDSSQCFAGCDGGNFLIQTSGNGWANKLVVDTAGNVGLGIDNPNWPLTVQRSSGTTTIGCKNTGGNAGVYIEASDGNTAKLELVEAGTGSYSLQVGNDNALMFFDDSTERLRIKSNGQIDLGTSGTNKAQFCQSGNNHYVVGQAADNVAALEVYSQHGSSYNKISFGVYDNRTGSKSASFLIRGDGSVEDSKGNLRSIPQNASSSAYTLAASDVGKHVYHTSTGAITVPATSGVFNVGDAVTIVNGHASDSFEILSAGGVTIWLAGAATPTSGTRTLAVKGICTLICVSSNGYYISGAGLT